MNDITTADVDFTAEDRGKYRHPETVGDRSYAELEELVFDALDDDLDAGDRRGFRTLMRIKNHAGLPTAFDLSPVIEGMELDKKIRRESNGNITAFFRYDEKPKRMWINGDGTVGAEFEKDFIPSAELTHTATTDFLGQQKTPTTNNVPRGLGRGVTIEITEEQIENLAASLKNVHEISAALGYANNTGFHKRLKKDTKLRDAYDRGRKRYARTKGIHATNVLAEDAAIEHEKQEKTMSMTTATDKPVKESGLSCTVDELEDHAATLGSLKAVAVKLRFDGKRPSITLRNKLRWLPEHKAAFDRGIARFNEANPNVGGTVDRRGRKPKQNETTITSHAGETPAKGAFISQEALSEIQPQEKLAGETQEPMSTDDLLDEADTEPTADGSKLTPERVHELSNMADDIAIAEEAEIFNESIRPPGMTDEEFDQTLRRIIIDLFNDVSDDLFDNKSLDDPQPQAFQDNVVLTPLPKTFITFDSDEESQLAVAFEGNIFNLSKRDRMILDLITNLMQSYRSGELKDALKYEVHFSTTVKPKSRWERLMEAFS